MTGTRRVFALAVAAALSAAPDAKAAEPEVTTGMIAVATPAIYYESAGKGRPVILIHGGQLDRRIWDDQFMVLAREFRVVRYDVRGFGRSPAASAPWSPTGDLAALMDQLGIPKAELVGLSLGGRIAIDFALEHPERVSSLVLAGPGLSGFDWSRDSDAGFAAILAAAQSGDPMRAADLWLTDPYMAPAMENPALAPRLRALARENTACWLDNPLLEQAITPPAAGRLASLKKPVLLVVGDRDVADIQRIVEKLEAEVAGARKHVVRGAGHMVNMEKPEEFTRVVLEFLRARSAS